MDKMKLFRVILSPIAFLIGVFIVWGGIIFPTTVIMFFSFVGFVSAPFTYLFNKTGSKIEYIDSIFDGITKYTSVNHFLGLTVLIWFPFYNTYNYIETGEILCVQ